MVLPTVDAAVQHALYAAGVDVCCRRRTAVRNSPNMLYDRTIALSVGERGVLLRDDRSQAQKNAASHSNTAETYAQVDLPHVPVAAHCAATAAAGRGCSVVGSWLLCCSIVCCLCCVQTQNKWYRYCTYYCCTSHEIPKYDGISAVCTYKIRPLVLKPGKSSYPLPPEKL